MFNSVKMWILLTHTLLGKHSMLGDAHTGQRVSLVSHMLCFTCVSVCLWERRRNICFYSLVEAFIKIYLPNITVSAVCVRLKVCKWLLVNACIPIWLDKDVVAFSSLLFQLEVGLFFPEVFSGCKSTLVCVREWMHWIRVQLVLNTCSKTARVLKWTQKRTHPQTQTETRQCGREILSLSLSFPLFLSLCNLSFNCCCFISMTKVFTMR